jgi:hypothetical protein
MRQVLDMLVWLAVIAVVGAVIYIAPRFAHSVASMGSQHGQAGKTGHEIVLLNPDDAEDNP